MARLGQNEELKVEEVAVEIEKEEPVPANVYTLSSGVRIQFIKRLPQATTQQVVVTTFQDANLDSEGQVRENMSSMEQLKLAKRMFDYNKSLLSFAQSFGAIKLYDGLPSDTTWLEYLEMNPQVRNDNPYVNFNKRVHQELLYLLYVAFANESDLELISEHLLTR